MTNLIIVFNKLDIASAFNNSTLEVSENLIDFDLEIGFSEDLDHFHILLPETNIIENSFNSNQDNFNKHNPAFSEILLIQLSEDLSQWNEDFKNDFIKYASSFDNIYVSYHKGPNDGDDIRNGKHRLIENYLEDQAIITIDKYHHEFFMGEEEQLYGVLANAILESKGNFSKESYDDLVKRLIAFISSEESRKETEINLLQESITNVGKEYHSKKAYEYCVKLIPDFEELLKTAEGIDQIKSVLNKRIIKL